MNQDDVATFAEADLGECAPQPSVSHKQNGARANAPPPPLRHFHLQASMHDC